MTGRARPVLFPLLASLALLLSAGAAAGGRERVPERPRERPTERPSERPTEPRPCKCLKREPPLALEALTPGAFAERVIGRAHAYDRGVRACLRRASASSIRLSFSFRAGAADPRVSASGPRELAACVERLTWHSFDAPPRAVTVRVDVRISDGPDPQASVDSASSR